MTGVVTGNLRLLLGMLRANRPWRLAVRLSRALVTAVAAGTFALVTTDIRRLSAALGPLRLVLLTVGSVAAVVLTIVIGAGLWERVPSGSGATWVGRRCPSALSASICSSLSRGYAPCRSGVSAFTARALPLLLAE